MATSKSSKSASSAARSTGSRPNILVIFGEDIGIPQVSAYTRGLMGKPSSWCVALTG